jgi:hypothetical protein
MFKSIITFCITISNVATNQCIAFQDTYGPYKTQQECYERSIEMGITPATIDYALLKLGYPQTYVALPYCEELKNTL